MLSAPGRWWTAAAVAEMVPREAHHHQRGWIRIRRTRTQFTLGVMPFLIMGAVAAVAVLVGRGAGVLPLLSLGPAFAAVSGELRHTLITGAVAVLLCVALAAYPHLLASQQDILAIATVAGVTVAGVIASAGRLRRERELANVTAIAEATQQVLLHPVPQQVGAVKLAVRYISAASGARIGGDLYEVLETSTGMRLIIGDVLGKGLPAVQTAATVLGAFRETAYDAASLAVIAERIEASLARQITSEQFVTAVIAQVNSDGSKIELLNCGHPPPLLLSAGRTRFVEPPETGLPLGLAPLANTAGQPATIGFGPGDRILFYTDGISEARGKSGEFFPLATSAALSGSHEPGAALRGLSEEVVAYVGHALDDDAAMLLLDRDPAS